MKLDPRVELTNEKIVEIKEFFDGPTRNACLAALEDVITSKKSKGGIIKVYLENFKEFNDTFGYAAGGSLIKEIAFFLCQFYEADVYRLRGVELILILDDCSHATILDIAQDIAERFEYSWKIGDIDCMCSISVGMAYYPGHATTVDDMLENLSHAIYEGTKIGPNQIVLYNEDLKLRLYRRHTIANSIPQLLEQGRLEIRFRPILNISTGRFISAECSLRLFTEEFGIINASEFVPIAEETGQISAITRYLIQNACKTISNLLWAGLEFEYIIVPVSPIQFLQEPFVQEVADMVGRSGIPPQYLCFQIAESMMISSFSNVQLRMFDLSDIGIKLMLDDFGSGYSGVNHLLTLPVDIVKLDRLFVWQLETNPRSAPLINGLLSMAKEIGLEAVGDVETEHQSKLLQEYGCDYQLGFFHTPIVTEAKLKEAFSKSASEIIFNRTPDGR